MNRYTYVLNNPQTLIDPSGYFHKIKKEPSWKRIFGIVVGVVFGNAVKQIVEPALRGDGIGVFFGFVSAVAEYFGQGWVRQLLSGAHSAFYGGSFWKGYINGWSPFASSIGYDGFAGSPGSSWASGFSGDMTFGTTGGPGTDFPIQVACSFCSGLFVGNAYAGDNDTGRVVIRPGLTIRNQHLAGKNHKSGIPFDKDGFPDFSKVSIKTVDINQTGTRAVDSLLANRAAGLDATPKGYLWHHHQNGRTMQLVPERIHQQTGHTGGVAVNK